MSLNRWSLPNRKLLSCRWILVRLLIWILPSIISHSTSAQSLSKRVATNDTGNYRIPAAQYDSVQFSRIIDRYKFTVNFASLFGGMIPPKTGIGEHRHQYSEELYVLLNGEAEFTVNNRTGKLKAPVMVPCSNDDSISIYNPGDEAIHFLSFGISEKRVRRDTIVASVRNKVAKFDSIPSFVYWKLDRNALKSTGDPYPGKGVVFAKLLNPDVFATNWKGIDHVIIPAGDSMSAHKLDEIEEVYYVMKGSGIAIVNKDSASAYISAHKAFTASSGEKVTLVNNGKEDMELLVISVADKLQKSFFTPYILALCLSFLVSLTLYLKPVPSETYLKLFPPLLLATIVIEYWGYYLTVRDQNNMMLYNFFTLFEFLYYLIIISLIITSTKMKKAIMITLVLYTLIAVANILFIQGSKEFHSMGYSLGCLIIVTFCVYFFLELFRSPKSIKLTNNPAFWICSGLLFFYCCGFPLWALAKYWGDISSVVLSNFQQIVMILNVFLYSIFTIAFVCIRTRKYSSSQS